jgi:hypothetical protein
MSVLYDSTYTVIYPLCVHTIVLASGSVVGAGGPGMRRQCCPWSSHWPLLSNLPASISFPGTLHTHTLAMRSTPLALNQFPSEDFSDPPVLCASPQASVVLRSSLCGSISGLPSGAELVHRAPSLSLGQTDWTRALTDQSSAGCFSPGSSPFLWPDFTPAFESRRRPLSPLPN